MADVLAEICARKLEHVAQRKRELPLGELERRLPADPPRGFVSALTATLERERFALIAEIKKASPSRGLIRDDFDPPALARAYADGGAACLSVLTDQPYFQGRDAYLSDARAVVALPCLRKDFMVDPYQITEARVLGADAVLLILAAVDDALAGDLVSEATRLGMDVLAEVHDAAELERACTFPTGVIGINNRNLKTLSVDLATTEALAARVPPDRLVVSESGLYSLADLERMHVVGVRSFLVGESLMRQADVRQATARLLGLEVVA